METVHSDTSKGIANLFNSITSLKDIEKLIYDGEAEGQYLECKSPLSPQGLNKYLKSEITKEISGFSNAGGGIILFGVSTDKKHGLDVLTQIDPIGLVKQFEKKLELSLPLMTEPPVKTNIKILKEKPTDTKGVVAVFVPKTSGDPIKASDGKFYLRTGDQTPEMPYETIKRMFVGSASPDLSAEFRSKLVKRDKDGRWKIPIVVRNKANAPAKSTEVTVEFRNSSACQNISSSSFRDISHVNPDLKLFAITPNRIIYKGLNIVVGDFSILMKPRKRKVDMTVNLHAEHMRARFFDFKINLLSNGRFAVKETGNDYLY